MKNKAMLFLVHVFTTIVQISILINFSEGKIIIQGDFVVTGLFGVYEPHGEKCGETVDINSVMNVQAIKWYLDQLNIHGKLPFRIGFESFETCSLDAKAAEHAVTILGRALDNRTILGVVGPERSSEAETISHILGSVPQVDQLLQVGFSTTAALLGNNKEYPNFVRVVPNDDIQVEMMVKSMVGLEWNRIAVVYEDNVYGQDGYTRLKTRAEGEGICIALTRTIQFNNLISPTEITQLLQDIIIGVPQSRPPVNGIVLIASEFVSNFVMLSLDKSKYSSFPIIMLSDGSSLDGTVFKQSNGDVIGKSKGSVVLAPPYRQITEFMEHWTAIFTNATLFDLESTSNPWLRDVLHEVTKCDAKNCNFRVVTNDELKQYFTHQPLYVSYAIFAAHAIVKASIKLRETYCVSQPNSCPAFDANFHHGDMIKTIKNMSIDFKNDFSWGPNSLMSEGTQFSISQSGEVIQKESSPLYELFNIQTERNPQSDGIKFEKVGSLIKDELIINFDAIRDYTATGEEKQWPNVRKAQCSPNEKCSECIPLKELQEDIIFDAGDAYVIGVAPIFLPDGIQDCGKISDNSGYQLAEAIKFAVQKINSKSGDFSNYFPKMTVGLIIINSCRSPAVVQRKIYDLHRNGLTLENGTVVEVKDKIIGYVAEYTSTVSIAVASALSILKSVQISYASTSPALSDRVKYPYFMRVVTPDDAQAKAMIEIVKQLNANYIQIVYSAGDYGTDGRDKVMESAASNKICVVQDLAVRDDDSSFQIYDKLRKNAQAKIVIVFLYPNHLRKLVSALTTQMKRGEFVFIGSEAWARDGAVLAVDTNQILIGSFTVSLEMYKDRELRSHVQNIKSTTFRKDPWAMMFIQAKRNCYFDLSFDKTQADKCHEDNDHSRDPNFDLDTYDTQAYVATKCLLIGANAYLETKCGSSVSSLCTDFTSNTEGLVDEILKVKMELDGSGNKMKVFDGNGDGNIGYRIYNIQKDDGDLSKLTYKEVGRFPLEGTFTFETDKIVHPNDSPVRSSCPNAHICSSCYADTGNTKMGDSDAQTDKTEITSTLVKVFGALLGVTFIISIVLAVLLYKKRKQIERDNDLELFRRPKMAYAQDELTMNRDEATPSKIYFEINAEPHERRYVPLEKNNQCNYEHQ